MRHCLATSFFRLVDLSKTDGCCLYECCFPAPQQQHFTTLDVHCLNSGVPLGNPEKPWNCKLAPMAAKVIKSVPKHAQTTWKRELNTTRIQFLRKVVFGNTFHLKTLLHEPQASRFRQKNDYCREPEIGGRTARPRDDLRCCLVRYWGMFTNWYFFNFRFILKSMCVIDLL